jgi:hypothetical protein
MNHSVIGLDIAEHVFHIYTIQADGKSFKKMLKRQEVWSFLPIIQTAQSFAARREAEQSPEGLDVFVELFAYVMSLWKCYLNCITRIIS